MQNGINFFGWIREGVKQSVLLGVSDAIETIGTPDDPQTIHPQVAALMATNGRANGIDSRSSNSHAARLPGQHAATAGGAQKKRLGRSLKDIETPS